LGRLSPASRSRPLPRAANLPSFLLPLAMAACVVPAAAARPAGLKRRRIAVSSAEPYEEISRPGEGAFGAVVMARHRATGQIVAIKS
jgi:hypothetical protein